MIGERITHIRENLKAGLATVGVSFGRWGLYADDKYVRRRWYIKGWIWTPFYKYVKRTPGIQFRPGLMTKPKMEFTRHVE